MQSVAELADEIAAAGKHAPKALGEIARVSRNKSFKRFKEVANSKGFLKGSMSISRGLGARKVRELMTSNNRRISPVLMIAIIAYLETEKLNGNLFGHLPEAQQRENEKALDAVVVKSLATFAAGESKKSPTQIYNDISSAAYQLMMIAILHGSNKPIAGIEAHRNVYLFGDKKNLQKAVGGRSSRGGLKIRRIADIVVGDGSMGTSWKEQWIEVKSYKSVSKDNLSVASPPTPWTWNTEEKKHEKTHKQFTLDRVAHKIGAAITPTEATHLGLELGADAMPITVNNVAWSFQDYKMKNSRSPSKAKLIEAFAKKVKGSPPGGHMVELNTAKAYIELGTVATFMDVSKTELKEAIQEELELQVEQSVNLTN